MLSQTHACGAGEERMPEDVIMLQGLADRAPTKRLAMHMPLRLRVGASGLLLLVIASVLPLVLGLHPNAPNGLEILQAPSIDHLLGTDDLGRDTLARVLSGLRVSVMVGAAVSLGSFVIGMPLGLLAAYSPRVGMVVMRLTDALMAIPAILLAIALVTIVTPGLGTVAAILIVVWTPLTVRMARGGALEVLAKEYVQSAVVAGVPRWQILWRYVGRNAIDPVIVQQTVAFAGGVLGEATLSFVGAGIQPPESSLGNILAESQNVLYQSPWMTLSAGVALALLVLCVILCGDGLRDILAHDD